MQMGAMSTAWLRLEALPDPTIEAEAEARARAAAGLPYTSYSAAAAAGRRGGAATGTARVSTAGSERSGGGGVRSWRPRLSLHLNSSSALQLGAAAAGASPSKPFKTGGGGGGGKRGAGGRGGSGGGAIDSAHTSPLPKGRGGEVADAPPSYSSAAGAAARPPPPLLPGDSDYSIATLPSQQGGGASGYDDDIGGCSGLMGGLETVAEAGRDYQQGEGLPAGKQPHQQQLQHPALVPQAELAQAPNLATTVTTASGYGGRDARA